MEHIVTRVSLSAQGVPTVTLEGGEQADRWRVTSLQGWWNPSNAKTQLSEREAGDGAHDIPVDDIQYSARTVSIGYKVESRAQDVPGRSQVLQMVNALRLMVHRAVTVRVVDSTYDLYCSGYLSQFTMKTDQRGSQGQSASGTVDVVCPRPEILSVDARSWQLGAKPIAATSGASVGLRYSKSGKTGLTGLAYPLRYAEGALPSMGNVCVLENHGTSRAYPVFTCNGPLPHGVRLTFGGLQEPLVCEQPVYGVPLVLDSRSRSAEVGGLDVSRTLSSRGFPVVEPGGSLPVTLSADGTGWVDASVRDTYM